jgi:hypothetical protein
MTAAFEKSAASRLLEGSTMPWWLSDAQMIYLLLRVVANVIAWNSWDWLKIVVRLLAKNGFKLSW